MLAAPEGVDSESAGAASVVARSSVAEGVKPAPPGGAPGDGPAFSIG
jgi:hypothetical protein